MTLTSAAPMPVSSVRPEEPLLEDAEAVAAVVVAVPVADATVVVATLARAWLIVGRATFPFTSHPPAVDVGHAGVVMLGE